MRIWWNPEESVEGVLKNDTGYVPWVAAFPDRSGLDEDVPPGLVSDSLPIGELALSSWAEYEQ